MIYMATVTMTIEEYIALTQELAELKGVRRSQVATAQLRQIGSETRKKKRNGKAAKGMAKAMKEANAKLRTKSGKLRKGKTQGDVTRLAHKIRRKYA